MALRLLVFSVSVDGRRIGLVEGADDDLIDAGVRRLGGGEDDAAVAKVYASNVGLTLPGEG